MNNIITCHNCWIKGDCRTCEHKSNLELENQNAEQAIASIYKTFCLFCLILIAITLI
jgi:hypothetical protein